MANGTINLVNNSTALTGVDSNFLTEVTPGDFIYVEVGDVPYTLPVDKINSDSSITLLRKFIGPTTSGLVWVLIPRRAQNAVYSKLADQVSQALYQALINEDNWQQLLTGEGNVIITRPDGSQYEGPAWNEIIKLLGGKVDKDSLNDIEKKLDEKADKESLGNSAGLDVGTADKTVAAGNDKRFETVDGKTGGIIEGDLRVKQGNRIGTSTQVGGNKNIELYSITGDGDLANYVNCVTGNWYGGHWALGCFRGNGTDLARVQLNIDSGAGYGASYLFHPTGRFELNSCAAYGERYGGGWTDIVGWNANISFYRENLLFANDAGFVPFGRWHSYCAGGYYSTAGIGSIATGAQSFADIVLTTLCDNGAAGQRIFQFGTLSGDIYSTGGGGVPGNYVFSKQPNCDITLKHDVKYDDGYKSYENIKQIKPATYIYNGDLRERVRRGVIAQDVMKIDSEYVKLVPAAPQFDDEGNRVDGDDTLALDNNVLLLDTALGLHYLIKQVESLHDEVQSLRKVVDNMNQK